MSIQILDDSGTTNGLGVNTDHEAKVALTLDSEKSGFASLVSEKGIYPSGTRYMKELELSEDYRLRTELDAILFADYPVGTNLNSSIWSTRLSASQTVVLGSNRYELNSSGLTTINSGSMLRTVRTFQWYKANALYCETAIAWTLTPVANWFAEWGIFTASTAIATITDGVFFRITAGQFRGVICNNSTETYVDLGAIPAAAVVYDTVIELCQDIVHFWVNGVLLGSVAVPGAQFGPLGLQQCQYAARTYNGGVIPAAAIKLQLSAIQVSNGGSDNNRLWPTVRSGMGFGSYQIPSGAAAGQTANWANSAAVTAIAAGSLSNTTGSFTGLGGMFRFGAPAGADTDFHIMKYQVPIGSTLIVRGVTLDAFNQGAVVAGTPTVIQWAIAVGSTADTLAGTEDLVGVKVRRIVPLGITSWLVGALVGALAPTIDRNYDVPLTIHGGEYFSLVAKVILGTATVSQEIRGQMQVNGYFE
jgi:hypothetical protein